MLLVGNQAVHIRIAALRPYTLACISRRHSADICGVCLLRGYIIFRRKADRLRQNFIILQNRLPFLAARKAHVHACPVICADTAVPRRKAVLHQSCLLQIIKGNIFQIILSVNLHRSPSFSSIIQKAETHPRYSGNRFSPHLSAPLPHQSGNHIPFPSDIPAQCMSLPHE